MSGERVAETRPADAARSFRHYAHRLTAALEAVNDRDYEAVARCLMQARSRRGTVFVAGNGGSAATASHWVSDLRTAATDEGSPVHAVSLTDNTSVLSALANDHGYEWVFSRQLRSLARPHDVLVVVSVSGRSPNLVRAVEQARAIGMETIGLLGGDGGDLVTLVDHAVVVSPTKLTYGLVESAHVVLADALAEHLRYADRP